MRTSDMTFSSVLIVISILFPELQSGCEALSRRSPCGTPGYMESRRMAGFHRTSLAFTTSNGLLVGGLSPVAAQPGLCGVESDGVPLLTLPNRCARSYSVGAARWSASSTPLQMGDQDDGDEEGKTFIDKLFDPLVERYSELEPGEQQQIAFMYQGAYFAVCLYVGVVLVRAYKAWYLGGGQSPF